MICQKKKQSSGRAKTNARASRRLRKQANLCAKKWSTFEKVNTAHAPPNKQSPLACQRPAAPARNCRRQNQGRLRRTRSVKPNAIWPKVAAGAGNLHARDRAQRSARSRGRAGRLLHEAHCLVRRAARHARGLRGPGQPRQRKQFRTRKRRRG